MNPRTRTVLFSLAGVAMMAGLVVASVPLYSLFCKATGYTGLPRIVKADTATVSSGMVTVRFDGGVMHDMPWRFRPNQTSVRLHLGQTNLATFEAENLSDQAITGTAVFNVTPLKAAQYVDKISCFCFTKQTLGPKETAQMPVSFYIDPAIAKDPDTTDVHTITLSYTFFKARDQSAAAAKTTVGANQRAGG